MSAEETEFKAFWTHVKEISDYELRKDIKPFLKKALEYAGFFDTEEFQFQTFHNQLEKFCPFELPQDFKDNIDTAVTTAIDARSMR